jgi:hypothetical protein
MFIPERSAIMDTLNLAKGARVTYDDGFQGRREGVVAKREVIAPYIKGGEARVYYLFDGRETITSASKILEVVTA